MSLSKYVESKFGTKTRSLQNPLINQIAVTVTKVLNNNPDRLSYTVINLSGNNVYVAFDQAVSASRGILIAASGGSLTLIAEEDGELAGYELFGIAVGGVADIYTIVTEGE